MKNILVVTLIALLSGCATPISIQERQAATDAANPWLQKAIAATSPIYVYRMGPTEPNSAGGVSVNAQLRILSEKPIKYIRFEVTPFNGVGDEVTSQIGRKKEAIMSMTGPLLNDQFHYPHWSNSWYNHSIRCIVINHILVTFMDDTTASLGEAKSRDGASEKHKPTPDLLKTALAPNISRDCKPQL